MKDLYTEIPRVYTAVAEWAACITFLSLQNNLKKTRFVFYSVIFLVIQIIYLVSTKNVPILLWIPCMLGAVALMFLFLLLCGGLPIWGTGYCCVSAFLLAEFVASFEWQLHSWIFEVFPFSYGIQQVFFCLVYTTLFLGTFFLEKRFMKPDYFSQITKKELLSVSGIVLLVFTFSNLSFLYTDLPFTSAIPQQIGNIRTLVDLGGLATFSSFQNWIAEYHADKELTAINNILHSQYEQYRNYQDSLDIVNIKYHDLKHQLALLRSEPDWEKRIAWIDSMEQELEVQHPIFQTGSSILDTLLESKRARFQKNGVRFTCIADGKLLSEINVMDICSIFGNALDNAIESVLLVEKEEKRIVSMSVSSMKNFIYIKVENYCQSPVQLEKGKLPQTSKKDKENHGYGIKSIQYCVKKYNGTCSLQCENHWFKLSILIPMLTQTN